jgi:hypothetical protein
MCDTQAEVAELWDGLLWRPAAITAARAVVGPIRRAAHLGDRIVEDDQQLGEAGIDVVHVIRLVGAKVKTLDVALIVREVLNADPHVLPKQWTEHE